MDILPLDSMTHRALDRRPCQALLVPTRATMYALCLHAESVMLKQESIMARQLPGKLWRMSPEQLMDGWAYFVNVGDAKVPLFEYHIRYFATRPELIGMAGPRSPMVSK